MVRGTTQQRIAGALTAVLVAVLLVTVGGATRLTSHRATAGSGQLAAAPHPGGTQHLTTSSGHQQTPLHLDLASTPPISTVSTSGARAAVDAVTTDVHPGRDLAAPNGRAPPAL
jgi:hypothetical protein